MLLQLFNLVSYSCCNMTTLRHGMPEKKQLVCMTCRLTMVEGKHMWGEKPAVIERSETTQQLERFPETQKNIIHQLSLAEIQNKCNNS